MWRKGTICGGMGGRGGGGFTGHGGHSTVFEGPLLLGGRLSPPFPLWTGFEIYSSVVELSGLLAPVASVLLRSEHVISTNDCHV